MDSYMLTDGTSSKDEGEIGKPLTVASKKERFAKEDSSDGMSFASLEEVIKNKEKKEDSLDKKEDVSIKKKERLYKANNVLIVHATIVKIEDNADTKN